MQEHSNSSWVYCMASEGLDFLKEWGQFTSDKSCQCLVPSVCSPLFGHNRYSTHCTLHVIMFMCSLLLWLLRSKALQLILSLGLQPRLHLVFFFPPLTTFNKTNNMQHNLLGSYWETNHMKQKWVALRLKTLTQKDHEEPPARTSSSPAGAPWRPESLLPMDPLQQVSTLVYTLLKCPCCSNKSQ